MSEYTPDKWVMLKLSYDGEVIYKILATWYGGFANGDSWKLNSGITKIEEDGQTYLFHGSSGSVYRCHKNSYGMNGYTAGVLANFRNELDAIEKSSLELLPEETNFMEIAYV